MLDEKLKISRLKKSIFGILGFMFIFINAIGPIQANNFGIPLIFTLIFILVPGIGFFKILQTKNYKIDLSFRNITKAYIEIGVLILGVCFELVYSLVFKRNPLVLVPFALLLVELVTLRFLELSYKTNSVRSNFFAAVNNIDLDADINIGWRLKFYFNPSFNIKNLRKGAHKQRLNLIFSVVVLIVLLGSFSHNMRFSSIINIAFILFAVIQKPFRYILDKIFRTYVRFDGICISEEITVNDETSNTYYYRIVDFHNKREFILKTGSQKNIYSSGDKVTVIHGALSKVYLDHYKRA